MKRKRKIKILRIEEIVFDKNFYPRSKVSWLVAYKYAQAMKTGAKFPPIIVAEKNRKHVLIDGWHRIEAYKQNKENFIQAEILYGLSDKDIFIEAVKRNIMHGQPLSVSEVANVVVRLKDLKLKDFEISNLVRIKVDKLEGFVADRITNILTGEVIILKKPLKHLSGEARVSEDIASIQEKFHGVSQEGMLDELIVMLKENLIDLKNEGVRKRLEELHNLIEKILIKI